MLRIINFICSLLDEFVGEVIGPFNLGGLADVLKMLLQAWTGSGDFKAFLIVGYLFDGV